LRSKRRKGRNATLRPGKKSAYWRGEKIVLFLKRGIIVLSAVILLIVLLISARNIAKTFRVRNILVSGNFHLEEGEVKSAVNVSYGSNLLQLSLDELEENLKKKAWIKKVILRRQFPDTIMVNIEEAVPKALLKLDGQTFIVDIDGKVLERIDDNITPFLPVIVGIDPDKDRGGVLEALKLIEALTGEGFLEQKESIELMLKPYGLVLNIDGDYVKVGYGRYIEKLGRWKDLESRIKQQNLVVDYVDLRYENEVVVKPIKKSGKGNNENVQ
jgi:cell division protein FtsQ